GTNDTIQFSVNGTILLGSNQQQLTRSVSILGPGASLLSVDGNANAFQPFNIAAAVTVTIAGLTIANGGAVHGGGINNSGTLTVQNSTLSGNTAGGGGTGGGIYVNNGTATLQNTIVAGNGASDIHRFAGMLNASNSLIQNLTGGFGGGTNTA